MAVLDIIIPQYKEDENKIKYLLHSIEAQIGVNKADFTVTVINDHSDVILSAEFLQKFDLNLTYYVLDRNVGPGLTRQCGIDNTKSPYIMFMDADDCMFRVDALTNIFAYLGELQKDPDEWGILQTFFYEEVLVPHFHLHPHNDNNMVFLHGKIFNRSYLEKYNIRFNPKLRIFEDTYFCKICTLCSPTPVRNFAFDTYLWKRFPESISSNWDHDGKTYMYWGVDSFVECNEGCVNFFADKDIPRKSELLFATVGFVYFLLLTNDYVNDQGENKSKLFDMCARIIWAYSKDLINFTDEQKYESLELMYKQVSHQDAVPDSFDIVSGWNDFIVTNYSKCSAKYTNWLINYTKEK